MGSEIDLDIISEVAISLEPEGEVDLTLNLKEKSDQRLLLEGYNGRALFYRSETNREWTLHVPPGNT